MITQIQLTWVDVLLDKVFQKKRKKEEDIKIYYSITCTNQKALGDGVGKY